MLWRHFCCDKHQKGMFTMELINKNISKKILSVLFVIITVFSTFSIASVNSYAAMSNSYTVTTKSNYWYPGSESITIKQTKEKYYTNWKKTKTSTRYMSYTVTCTPTRWSGSKPATITKNFKSGSITIKLQKNVTYSVRIVPNNFDPYNSYGSFGTVNAGYARITSAHKATYY